MTSTENALITTRTHSLNDVRDIIPAPCYQRSAGRAASTIMRVMSMSAREGVGRFLPGPAGTSGAVSGEAVFLATGWVLDIWTAGARNAPL